MIAREEILPVIFALGVAMLVSFVATPLVKRLAYKIGAVDVPKDNRRMHDHPIPRLGGLAIFIGCVVSILAFAEIDMNLRGILLGSCLVVAVGVVDDSHPLGAGVKFILQIVAALIAVGHGVVIETIANPFPWGGTYWSFGIWAVPITVIWIVAVTNSVNLIDGLDGLADGVSTIGAFTMLVIALLMGDLEIAVITAALVGACVGFLPFNRNPAKIFMGDTGSLFLGGAVCGLAFALDIPLVLILVGIVYIAETLSDIIQVTYFKLTHGKRIFRMAPLHHHLEMGGWSETKLFCVFSGITLVLCLLAFLGVMNRYPM